MKTFFSFLVLCFLSVEASVAYANHPASSKEKLTNTKQREDKPTFKISERRILKKHSSNEQETSSFSMEELRVGVQKILEESEVQYFKSQCRYAFMSDKDVIMNRCEAKKTATPKKK